MRVPKLFRIFSSKSSASDNSPAPDVTAKGGKDDIQKTVTVTVDGSTPVYSDNLKEAWAAAHQDLPQAKGAEKFLNKIGMSIIHSFILPTIVRRPSMWILHSALTST